MMLRTSCVRPKIIQFPSWSIKQLWALSRQMQILPIPTTLQLCNVDVLQRLYQLQITGIWEYIRSDTPCRQNRCDQGLQLFPYHRYILDISGWMNILPLYSLVAILGKGTKDDRTSVDSREDDRFIPILPNMKLSRTKLWFNKQVKEPYS